LVAKDCEQVLIIFIHECICVHSLGWILMAHINESKQVYDPMLQLLINVKLI
jgi:hypothetical protein